MPKTNEITNKGWGGGKDHWTNERTNAAVGDKGRHVQCSPPTYILVAKTEKGRAWRTAGSKRRSAPEQNWTIETTSVGSQGPARYQRNQSENPCQTERIEGDSMIRLLLPGGSRIVLVRYPSGGAQNRMISALHTVQQHYQCLSIRIVW